MSNQGKTGSQGDGTIRNVTVIWDNETEPDSTIPGPPVYVCENDIVTVKLMNEGIDDDAGATIHWHGLHMLHDHNFCPNFYEDSETKIETCSSDQNIDLLRTQWADGVPTVTQCPITKGSNFTYTFFAVPAGTYWYHSHMAFQRDDGAYGSLVVREQKNGTTFKHLSPAYKNFLSQTCDPSDFTIIVAEWYKQSHDNGPPSSILVNGKGRLNNGFKSHDIPWSVFRLDKDECADKNYYRFRVIGAQANLCPIEVSIRDNDGAYYMNLTIIATDGQYVEPKIVNSFIITNGERYDFLIPAKNPNPDQAFYTMRFGSVIGFCRGNFSAIAFISYGDSAEINQTIPADPGKATNVPGPVLNGDNFDNYDNSVSITDLKSEFYFKYNQKKADKTFYMTYTVSPVGLGFNFLSFKIETLNKMGKPFLSDGDSLDSKDFCPNGGRLNGAEMGAPNDTCYNIIDINNNDVVDFFIINLFGSFHMLHMHGYHYRVLAEGNFEFPPNPPFNYAEYLLNQDEEGKINRNFDYPVKKDTLQAKPNGWNLIRIFAKNPGYWLTHCHFALHEMLGMNFVIKVGNRADWNIPTGFPTCGPTATIPAPDNFEPCPH